MIAFVVVVVVACAAAEPVPVESSAEIAERARALYVVGGEAYTKGRYDVAITAFDEVLRLSPRPAALFTLAQALRLQYFVDGDLDKLERAVANYRAYLEAEPDGPRRDHAAEHLSVLVPLLDRLRLEAAGGPAAPVVQPARLIVSSSTPGARASIDGGAPRDIPATFDVEPGARTVVVEAPLHVGAHRSTVAVAGAAVAVDVTLGLLPARLAILGADDAAVYVDGAPVVGRELSLPSGVHDVAVRSRGRVSFAERVELKPGETRTLIVNLPLTAVSVVGIGGVAAGGAVLLASSAPLLVALSIDAEAVRIEGIADTRALRVDEADAYRALPAERDLWTRTATVTAVVGAVVVVAGGLLLLTDEAPSSAIAP
ncbi:MAG: hypothetical protein Q8O67_17860 [Deltaproteobacteria bacterium]|nr:hypothetical protein [Deltaproteobacteria bacterium]